MRPSASFRATFAPEDAAGFRSAVWRHAGPGPDEPYEPLHHTMVDALETAPTRSKRIGITLLSDNAEDPPEEHSWATLATRAQQLAAMLHARGVRRNDAVL